MSSPAVGYAEYREWIDRNGEHLCSCGHPLKSHFADLSACPECEVWEPVHLRCEGFNLADGGRRFHGVTPSQEEK